MRRCGGGLIRQCDKGRQQLVEIQDVAIEKAERLLELIKELNKESHCKLKWRKSTASVIKASNAVKGDAENPSVVEFDPATRRLIDVVNRLDCLEVDIKESIRKARKTKKHLIEKAEQL